MHLTPASSASHLTKEVPNSWRVDIAFNDDVIMIKSRKQEQCVKNHFRYEWEVKLTYDADTIKCNKVRADHDMQPRGRAGRWQIRSSSCIPTHSILIRTG